MFKDLKEDFETSFPIEGQEGEFMALIPTHLVSQPNKPSHPYRVTLDMSYINDKMFDKGPCLIPNIAKVVARLRAHTYLFAMGIRKHYWQIKTQNPQSQCFFYREDEADELSVFTHQSLVMGCVYSSYTAQKATILAAKIFDDLVDEMRSTGDIPEQTYAPLKRALGKGKLLKINPMRMRKGMSIQLQVHYMQTTWLYCHRINSLSLKRLLK